MDRQVTFNVFKTLIIEQNIVFLKKISQETGLSEDLLRQKYLKPDYYLPIVEKTVPKKKWSTSL